MCRSSVRRADHAHVRTIATCGVRYRACTAAADLKNCPSAAIAKHARDMAMTPAALHASVETTTVAATRLAPIGPTSAVTAFSAMRSTPLISASGSASMYATFTVV